MSNHIMQNYNIYKLYSSNLVENSKERIESPNNPIFGMIEIPKINIYYPVFSNISEDLLKISPCKFYGKNINDSGNICIAAHNYNNSLFFSNINLLSNTDKVFLYDNAGNKYSYSVYKIYEVRDDDLSPLFDYDKNAKELTLITCNNFNSYRIVVKAKHDD